MEDCVKKVTGVSSSSEKLEIGDHIRAVRNVPHPSDDGPTRYYYGGDTTSMPLGFTGKVVRIHPDKVCVNTGSIHFYLHPDEVEKI